YRIVSPCEELDAVLLAAVSPVDGGAGGFQRRLESERPHQLQHSVAKCGANCRELALPRLMRVSVRVHQTAQELHALLARSSQVRRRDVLVVENAHLAQSRLDRDIRL